MKRLVLFVCLMAMVSGVRAATQYRDFTSAEGKTIRGCIKAYDPAKKMVTIERDNRKTAKVPVGVFSEADQAYIRDWEVLRCFMTDRFFKISAKRKRRDNEADSSTSRLQTESGSFQSEKKREVEDTHYEILLGNRSASEMKGLEIKYCIYYEQEERRNDKEVCSQGVYCGKLPAFSMASRGGKTIQTEAVSIFAEELPPGWSYGNESGRSSVDTVQRGDVHGIWIRVHLNLPSGQKGMREFCYPDSLSNSRAWVSSSIRAGMN